VLRIILLGVVLAYRAVPAAVRGRACAAIGRPASTSHLALAGLRSGDAGSFFRAANSWWAGPLAQTGAAR
jgi:hypothetical protein